MTLGVALGHVFTGNRTPCTSFGAASAVLGHFTSSPGSQADRGCDRASPRSVLRSDPGSSGDGVDLDGNGLRGGGSAATDLDRHADSLGPSSCIRTSSRAHEEPPLILSAGTKTWPHLRARLGGPDLSGVPLRTHPQKMQQQAPRLADSPWSGHLCFSSAQDTTPSGRQEHITRDVVTHIVEIRTCPLSSRSFTGAPTLRHWTAVTTYCHCA